MLPSQNPCRFSWYTRRNVSPSPYTLRVCTGCISVHRGQSANLNDTAWPYTCQGCDIVALQ